MDPPVPGIRGAYCIHNKDKDKIIMYYESDGIEDPEFMEELQKRLVRYMVPNEVHRLVNIFSGMPSAR